jgi:hypothetical protein
MGELAVDATGSIAAGAIAAQKLVPKDRGIVRFQWKWGVVENKGDVKKRRGDSQFGRS